MTDVSNEAVLAAEATPAESSAHAAPWRLRRLDIWLPLLIVVLDQITKFFVRANVPLYSTVTVIPGFVNITHVLNTGAAFGILNSSDFPARVAQWQRNRFVIGRLRVRIPPRAPNPAHGVSARVGEWLKPTVCKIVALTGYAGSNPAPGTRQ